MKSSDFDHVVEFPRGTNVVYVLFYLFKHGTVARPFYVGQTANLHGRMTDYSRGTFAAATDFKVGEVIRYLMKNDLRVKVGYNECTNRLKAMQEETRIIRDFRSQGVRLLNDFKGYDYRRAVRDDVRAQLHSFCDEAILRRR